MILNGLEIKTELDPVADNVKFPLVVVIVLPSILTLSKSALPSRSRLPFKSTLSLIMISPPAASIVKSPDVVVIVLESSLMLSASTLVNAPVDAELPPIVTPSIVPPLISQSAA